MTEYADAAGRLKRGSEALLLASADREPAGSSITEVSAGSARETLAIIADRIHSPLQVIQARVDRMEDEVTAGEIREQVLRINKALKHLTGSTPPERERVKRQETHPLPGLIVVPLLPISLQDQRTHESAHEWMTIGLFALPTSSRSTARARSMLL